MMQDAIQQFTGAFEAFMPNLVSAFIILVVGWFLALIISSVVRSILKRTGIDSRSPGKITLSQSVSKGVYYIVLFMVLVAFFQALGLTLIVEPINGLLNQVFAFVPQLAGAAVLGLVAWILASLLRIGVRKGLSAMKVDERVSGDGEKVPLTESVSEAVYWLVFLLFLPAILTALALDGLLVPVQGMLDKILGFLPNLVTAGILLLVGWFVARLVQRIVSSLLSAAGADRLSERVGMDKVLGEMKLSGLVGNIVYIFILIPVVISGLNALQLDSITTPASAMLSQILASIPLIFGAAVILGISFAIGKLVSGLVTTLLTGISFDRLFTLIGFGDEPRIGEQTPSALVGSLVMTVIMLFAAIEALGMLGFASIGELIMVFIGFAAHILFGLVILGIGIFVANKVADIVKSTGVSNASFLALLARVAVLLLAGSMALNHMGLASDIITLAFGLLLGALTVAAAIAFGLGGREFAAQKLEQWQEKLDNKD
jgi:hypothetical protein